MNANNLSEEIDESSHGLLPDGVWEGNEPRASNEPRGLQYSIRKKSQRTYAKTAAIDRTYQVKIHEIYQGQRLGDIRQGLHRMFEDILQEGRK